MITTAEKVCVDALTLPRNLRVEIAHRLLVSLEDEDFTDDAGDAWRVEIERRRKDFREGRAKAVTADEAMRQAQAAIG